MIKYTLTSFLFFTCRPPLELEVCLRVAFKSRDPDILVHNKNCICLPNKSIHISDQTRVTLGRCFLAGQEVMGFPSVTLFTITDILYIITSEVIDLHQQVFTEPFPSMNQNGSRCHCCLCKTLTLTILHFTFNN